ncbi:glycosyltransferase family 2 protein [Psychroflexus tropicus]|uniref:glycosyltransferase family 2 protein n=1 Tax=Psychroflexus tropicus TaxID=197345 RepID=UPI00036C6DC0|nr:glycosyltransferase [Psychroflexus tropicus]
MDTTNDVVLSICITTYNHEKFIKQTLDGVFMQKLDATVEVIIYNDASTDNSDKIIRDAIKDRANVRYMVQAKNKGIAGNFTDSIKAARGKYVAVLDGDDYWIDEYKLQKQIEFLEAHPECKGCFTDTLVKNEMEDSLTSVGALKSKHKRHINLENLEHGGFWIPTSTFVYKNEALKQPLPQIYQQIKMVDIFLFYLILEQGTLGYIDEVTAVYRKHDSGEWSGLDSLKKLDFRIDNLTKMQIHFSEHPVLGEIFNNRAKSQKKKKRNFKKQNVLGSIKNILKGNFN